MEEYRQAESEFIGTLGEELTSLARGPVGVEPDQSSSL